MTKSSSPARRSAHQDVVGTFNYFYCKVGASGAHGGDGQDGHGCGDFKADSHSTARTGSQVFSFLSGRALLGQEQPGVDPRNVFSLFGLDAAIGADEQPGPKCISLVQSR